MHSLYFSTLATNFGLSRNQYKIGIAIGVNIDQFGWGKIISEDS
jgi:hypothetical protein